MLMLHFVVNRCAERDSNGEIDMWLARDPYMLNYVHRAADHDRRNAAGFQVAGNQTHGLVANRSQGNQNGDIHLVFLHLTQNDRRILFDGLPLTVGGGD